jgi:hypothetical protein
VIRGWTCCIIITALLLLLGHNAWFLCLYLGTSCLSFPSVLSSYDLLLPVSVNGDPIPSLIPLRFTFFVIAYLYSLLKFLIKFSISDINKKRKKKKKKKEIYLDKPVSTSLILGLNNIQSSYELLEKIFNMSTLTKVCDN